MVAIGRPMLKRAIKKKKNTEKIIPVLGTHIPKVRR